MKKKKSLSKLKEEVWSLFSARLKERYADDEGNVRCFTCGANMRLNTTNCQGGHYLSRGAYFILIIPGLNVIGATYIYTATRLNFGRS